MVSNDYCERFPGGIIYEMNLHLAFPIAYVVQFPDVGPILRIVISKHI